MVPVELQFLKGLCIGFDLILSGCSDKESTIDVAADSIFLTVLRLGSPRSGGSRFGA